MNYHDLAPRRRRLGLTQTELARYLGTTKNTVARWERGERAMTLPTLVEFALSRLEEMTTEEREGAIAGGTVREGEDE